MQEQWHVLHCRHKVSQFLRTGQCGTCVFSLLLRSLLARCLFACLQRACQYRARRKRGHTPRGSRLTSRIGVSGVRSADGGMPVRTSWSETSSVSEPSELRRPCEAPLRRHGPGVGGPCWPCRCNTPSRARPSGQLGPRLSTRANSRPQSWNACSTLLTQQSRAACRYAGCRCL